MVAAKAVRNAVNSSAFTTPVGMPAESRMARVPLGVVLCELATEAGGEKDDALIVEAEELIVDAGLRVKPLISVLVDATDAFFFSGGSDPSIETIFIPTDFPVLAGIKRVVTPFFLMTVRGGWYEEQHGEFVSPVEYE